MEIHGFEVKNFRQVYYKEFPNMALLFQFLHKKLASGEEISVSFDILDSNDSPHHFDMNIKDGKMNVYLGWVVITKQCRSVVKALERIKEHVVNNLN